MAAPSNPQPPNPQPAKQQLPPISFELQDLIWRFAEDALSPLEETRLEELAAREPAAQLHLRRYLQIQSRSQDCDFEDPAERSDPSRVAISPGSNAWQLLPGIRIRLATDGLKVTRRSGIEFTPNYALARGAEPASITEIDDPQPDARLQIRIEQRSDRLCDVSITLTPTALEFARQKLTAELITPIGEVRQTVPVSNCCAEFAGLESGEYVVVVYGEDREVIRYVLEIAGDR